MPAQTEIQYALAKQVPDIACHAVFETNYGQLQLDSEDSKKVADLVERLLRAKLRGGPVQTEICPVCRTTHDKPLCPRPEDWCEHNVPRRFCTAVHEDER